MEPAAQQSGLNVKKAKKLAVTVTADNEFDIAMDIPLNAAWDTGKFGPKNARAVADMKYDQIGSDGRIHISGKAQGKGSAKLVFNVYGKKYNVKINVKK